MYNVSPAFLTKVKEGSRITSSKIGIGSGTIPPVFIGTDIIVDFEVESSIGSNNMPSIGSVVSNKLTLQLLNDDSLPTVLIGVPIRPFVAIDVVGDGSFEWIELGWFYADYSDVEKTYSMITISALDIMANYDRVRYDSALVFPATIQSVMAEMNTNYGITFATQTLPSVSLKTLPTNTVRQTIGLIASLITRNATINPIGEVEFKSLTSTGFTLDGDSYIDFKLKSDAIIKISQLSTVTDEESTPIIVGDSTGFALEFDNVNILDSAELQTVFDRQFPLSYYAYDMNSQGMPHIQVGDIIQLTDIEGVIRNLNIINHKLTFNGGLRSNFTVDAPTEEKTVVTVTGTSQLSQAIARSYKDLMVAMNNATELITGNQGGNVIVVMDDLTGKPKELVLSDTDDINTAQKIWRWNSSGLGFSNTGYDGTYGLAITSDGRIVADFINTGNLDADKVNITNLEVGVNVLMGANATITWSNLSLDSQTNLKGETGDTGLSGGTGEQGVQGIQGTIGDIGLTGSQGIKGDKGDTGSQGVQGLVGDDGTQYYTWLKYADSPTTGMNDLPTGKLYMGIALNKTNPTESSIYTDYKWSLIKGDIGNTGATGSQGVIGVTGNQGIQGVQGVIGSDGIKGDKGFTGDVGNDGYTPIKNTDYFDGDNGAKGDQGIIGDTGSQGVQGVIGNTGGQGIKGDIGNTGGVGATGSQGLKGNIGNTGSQGAKGDLGNTGGQGVKGDLGNTGARGIQGIQGGIGATGDDGVTTYTWVKYGTTSTGGTISDYPSGKDYIGFAYNKTSATESTNTSLYKWSLIKGATGNTGSQGVQGGTGATGSQGGQGIQGFKGDLGNTGSQGVKGTTGNTGSQGIKGNIGNTGSQGVIGVTGAKGTTGNTGSRGIQGIQGIQGNQANLPSYITSTKITATTIESPTLTGGTISGTVINGVTINGGTINGGNVNIGGSVVASQGLMMVKDVDDNVILSIDQNGLLAKSGKLQVIAQSPTGTEYWGLYSQNTTMGSQSIICKSATTSHNYESELSAYNGLLLNGFQGGTGGAMYHCRIWADLDGQDSNITAITVGSGLNFIVKSQFADNSYHVGESSMKLLPDGLHVPTIVGNDIYLGSNSDDRTSNAPWYGIGRSTALLTGSTADQTAIQVAGYWGLRLKSGGHNIDIPRNGDVTLDGYLLHSDSKHFSMELNTGIPGGLGISQGEITLPRPVAILGLSATVKSMDGFGSQGSWWNISVWVISTTKVGYYARNVVNSYGASLQWYLRVDGY